MQPIILYLGRVPYYVHRRRRRTLGIAVRSNGEVHVNAPLRMPLSELQEAVSKHAAWIVERRRTALVREARRRARRFVSGETIPYLGAELLLEVVEIGGLRRASARSRAEGLIVELPAGLEARARREATREAVGRWLLDEARRVLGRRHAAAAQRVGDAARDIVLKEMRTRWGSCGPKRVMSLNWRLILAPLSVIDYVLVHELTHIRIPDHSARFWEAVARALPEYREPRSWLDEHGDDLIL